MHYPIRDQFSREKINLAGGIKMKNDVIKKLPERILQFGEGNFLRAFVDNFIHQLNENELFNGSVAVVQPIPQGMADVINQQNGCYTVILRGLENGKAVDYSQKVTCISRAINPYTQFEEYMATIKNPDLRFIVSNTTEAGITYLESDKLTDAPPQSFPGKVTALLFERYQAFNGDLSKGFIFIPCELIDDNGDNLKNCVLRHASNWGLSQDFINWVNNANEFTNTLVDRIVTGFPKDEAEDLQKQLSYKDNLIVTGEPFHFFAIQARKEWMGILEESLPFAKAGLNVVFTEDVTPYKQRKVRILNGAHTMSVLAAFLKGKNTVKEMMDDSTFAEYLHRGIYNEIIPTLDLDKDDLHSFAASVFDRFGNPNIRHLLLSISLNSVSKFKARVLPSILEYHKRMGELPKELTFSFAALVAFYKGSEIRDGALIGSRNGEEYKIVDDMTVLEFFKNAWAEPETVVTKVCANTEFWGMDLNTLPGFAEKVANSLSELI